MTQIDHQQFLTREVPKLLQQLTKDTQASFGLMTAQHMVEHLTVSIKVATKRKEAPAGPPTERQLGFKRFVEKGAIFKYRPSTKTKADLPELKYGSFEEAIAQIQPAIDRFYAHFDANPDFKSYNSFMGELDFQELELFNAQHFRYHFWQFGLVPSFD